jgi:hypothetical protein
MDSLFLSKASLYKTAQVVATGAFVGVEWNARGLFFKCSDGLLRQAAELERFVL